MKFRKKPVVIDAEQWFQPSDSRHKRVDGVFSEEIRGLRGSSYVYGIKTLEGVMAVNDGDWIITGIKGEKYPCKPDIFEASYEPAEKP